MKNVSAIIVAFVLAIALGIFTVKNKPEEAPTPAISSGFHTVVYVSDGDTIKLEDGTRIRLIGIDTPESHANAKLSRDIEKRGISRTKQLNMGKKAAAYVEGFLKNQRVRLEYDVQQKDRYGRTLAYVYLEDGTFVNQKIIADGYAYPLTVPPNVRYAHLFKQWFDQAREQQRGLWQ